RGPAAPGTAGRREEGAPLASPTPGEIEHDHSSVVSDIEGSPSASGEHATSVHAGSVTHDVPPAGIESVSDATVLESGGEVAE
ncbi:MAG: hypothetical protein WAN59_08395, partial [Candidatus Baltobacteraceae bacterium]